MKANIVDQEEFLQSNHQSTPSAQKRKGRIVLTGNREERQSGQHIKITNGS